MDNKRAGTFHTTNITLILFIASSLSLSAFSQEAPPGSPGNLQVLPEEIVITEQYNRYQLRDLVFEAEEDMYNIFNQLVDDRRFKITCSTFDRYHSRIRTRECKPEFERRATQAEAQEHLAAFRTFFKTEEQNPGELDSGVSQPTAATPSYSSISKQQQELQAKMAELAQENTEFRDALIKYVQARQRYLQSTD